MARRKRTPPPRLTPTQARRIIRNGADDSENVIFTNHARRRMREHNVSDLQVLRCLQNGRVILEPEYDLGRDTWVCRVGWYTEGQQIEVVAAIREKIETIWVVTVIEGRR